MLAAVVLAILLTIAGCAPYALVEPVRTRIGDTYSVEPQVRWTSLRQGGRTELWTIDGPGLESIRFIKNVGDGETLFGRAVVTAGPGGGRTPEDKQPRFRATMTPSEIMELVADTWSVLGASKVQTTDLRPAKFGAADGFLFNFAFVWPDGAEARAMAAGAVVKQRLQLVVYSGTQLHYFDKYRPTVDRLLESIRIE